MRKFLAGTLASLAGTNKDVAHVSRGQMFDALWQDLIYLAQHDNVDANPETAIPAILNKMIQLLLEEERDMNSTGTGECIERILKAKMLDHMCRMAQTNKPPGMFRWIVHAISRIFQHMKSPLLAHMSIHKPVVQMIESHLSDSLDYEAKLEGLQLINSLILKLKEDPIFIRLFFRDKRKPESGSPVPAFEKPIESSPKGSPGTILATPIDEEDMFKGRDFTIFVALDRMYRAGGDSRIIEQLRRSILNCIAIDDSPEDNMAAYFLEQTEFMEFIVSELIERYWHAASATSHREDVRMQHLSVIELQEFIKAVHFCSNLTRIQKRDAFSTSLVIMIKDRFFEYVLRRRITMADTVDDANLHTVLTRETLLQLDSPIMFLTLLRSLLTEANDRLAIINRIQFSATRSWAEEQLAANTLRLLSTFVTMHTGDAFAIDSLVFDNFQAVPPRSLVDAAISLDKFAERISGIAVLQDGPDSYITASSEYKKHVKQKLKLQRSVVDFWRSDAEPSIDAEPLRDAPLIKLLHENMDHFFENSLDFNLFLTDIFVKLASYPSLTLHSYLLNGVDSESSRSLIVTLEKCLTYAAARFEEDPKLIDKAKQVRKTWLATPVLECNIKKQDEITRFVQGALILNDLCAELHGSLRAVEKMLATPKSPRRGL